MENVKIISDNGAEINVNGLFYVFNSKYYFIYTSGEIDENGYVKLYVVQVGKEIQNTPTGPIDTGYMLGMEISDPEEWKSVQNSITKIVEDKKGGTQNNEIQYLPMNMLVNLKIVSKNKFRLMKHIVEDDFKVALTSEDVNNISSDVDLNSGIINSTVVPAGQQAEQIYASTSNLQNAVGNILEKSGEVIIDYRTCFFEEQEKNKELEEQIKNLKEKLENIKSIIE